MAHRKCPICEVEVTQAHDCTQSEVFNFSLELELLGLPFVLDAYDLTGIPLITALSSDHSFASASRSKTIPFFLRV